MPTVPRGNTSAPTIAIVERAADLIRGRVPAVAAQAAGQPVGWLCHAGPVGGALAQPASHRITVRVASATGALRVLSQRA